MEVWIPTGRSDLFDWGPFHLFPALSYVVSRKRIGKHSGKFKVLQSSVARRQKAFRVTTCWRRILAPGAWHPHCAHDLWASISEERMAPQKQAVLGLPKPGPEISFLSAGSILRCLTGLPKVFFGQAAHVWLNFPSICWMCLEVNK